MNTATRTSRRWFWAGATLLAVAGLAAAFYWRRENLSLREQVVQLRVRHEAFVRGAEENRRTRELLARIARNDAAARAAMHAELIQTRTEAAELERKAREFTARKAAEAAAIEANHDPEKGLARLEDFKNVGRASPAAALQTLVWAGLKGDEAALTAALAVNGRTREKAEALLAGLPESARAKFPTPESLGALVVTGTILDATAAQLLDTTYPDAGHAIVAVRIADTGRDERVPLELAADGWKVSVPAKMIDRLAKRIAPPPEPPGRN